MLFATGEDAEKVKSLYVEEDDKVYDLFSFKALHTFFRYLRSKLFK